MFGRIVRLIKSWIGYFVSFAEDPEVMLHQAVEEMRNTVPKLNGVLVSTRATALKLESDVSGLRQQEARLTSSIKAALRDGTPQSRSIAEDEASTLQHVRESLANTLEQLAAANTAHANAVESIDELKRRLRARIEQAQRAIEEHRRARVLREAADALAELDAGTVGSTTEKHIEQVREKSAEARAAMEIALSGDLKQIANDRRLRKARAQSVLQEFEAEIASGEQKQIEGE